MDLIFGAPSLHFENRMPVSSSRVFLACLPPLSGDIPLRNCHVCGRFRSIVTPESQWNTQVLQCPKAGSRDNPNTTEDSNHTSIDGMVPSEFLHPSVQTIWRSNPCSWSGPRVVSLLPSLFFVFEIGSHLLQVCRQFPNLSVARRHSSYACITSSPSRCHCHSKFSPSRQA